MAVPLSDLSNGYPLFYRFQLGFKVCLQWWSFLSSQHLCDISRTSIRFEQITCFSNNKKWTQRNWRNWSVTQSRVVTLDLASEKETLYNAPHPKLSYSGLIQDQGLTISTHGWGEEKSLFLKHPKIYPILHSSWSCGRKVGPKTPSCQTQN